MPEVILNLGCGAKPVDGRVNVDYVDGPGVDVVWDLDKHPWPWPPETVDEIHALHIFEHVTDPLGFMEECWHILKPGGLLHIETPHWRSQNAYTDPTHQRYCTEDTFLYWVRGSWLWNSMGVVYHRNCAFAERSNRIDRDGNLIVDLERA